MSHKGGYCIFASCTTNVATLALGLRPRQRFAKVQAKREAWELHLIVDPSHSLVHLLQNKTTTMTYFPKPNYNNDYVQTCLMFLSSFKLQW
jgi:hypothetical protein